MTHNFEKGGELSKVLDSVRRDLDETIHRIHHGFDHVITMAAAAGLERTEQIELLTRIRDDFVTATALLLGKEGVEIIFDQEAIGPKKLQLLDNRGEL